MAAIRYHGAESLVVIKQIFPHKPDPVGRAPFTFPIIGLGAVTVVIVSKLPLTLGVPVSQHISQIAHVAYIFPQKMAFFISQNDICLNISQCVPHMPQYAPISAYAPHAVFTGKLIFYFICI